MFLSWEGSDYPGGGGVLQGKKDRDDRIGFCVCQSHICFSIKSLHFFVLDSDFKMPVLACQMNIHHSVMTIRIITKTVIMIINIIKMY